MNEIEKLLGIEPIDLGEEETAQMRKVQEEFPPGTKIAFRLPPNSLWRLEGITGVIFRHSDDPTRPLVVTIDYPALLPPEMEDALEPAPVPQWAIEYSSAHDCPVDSALSGNPWRKRVFATGDSIVRLEDYKGNLNYGLGESPSPDDLQKAKFVRAWEWVADWAAKDIEYEKVILEFNTADVGD